MPDAPPTPRRPHRLLLTGAAGQMGREMRPRLRAHCTVLRASDVTPELAPAAPGEERVVADLADRAAVLDLVAGVDAVVHLGGVSTEQAWEHIVAANINGTVHLYEAARRHGVRRIVLASSNHVTGYYPQEQVIDTRVPMRPDCLYGLSKAFCENLAQLYFDRHGIETVSLRIGSSWPEPKDCRMLASWLSFDDAERLIVAALGAPRVGHTVVYGMSDNTVRWWDNRHAAHLGFRPQDSSERFRAAVMAREPAREPDDPALLYQGGHFTQAGPHFLGE